jgi:hypothetical protein
MDTMEGCVKLIVNSMRVAMATKKAPPKIDDAFLQIIQ